MICLAGISTAKQTTLELTRKFSVICLIPINEVRRRPSKSIRSQLVRAAFNLALGDEEKPSNAEHNLEVCTQVIELIHLGSLIVDDVQDGSISRRGEPSLLVSIGAARSLACGNWLYFWAQRFMLKRACFKRHRSNYAFVAPSLIIWNWRIKDKPWIWEPLSIV